MGVVRVKNIYFDQDYNLKMSRLQDQDFNIPLGGMVEGHLGVPVDLPSELE
jgi:hypothetical protein